MSRLSSLRGPSTPSPAASRASPLPQTSSPTSPNARLIASHDPTSFHRKLRSVLVDVEKGLRDWEDIVLMDGLRAGKGCVDSRTELDNLTVIKGPYPYSPSPSSLLSRLAASKQGLREVLSKLEKRLIKLASLVEIADVLLTECTKLKGPAFANTTALWTTWSLDHFATSLPLLLSLLHHSLARLTLLSTTLSSSSTSFDDSKRALEAWQREGHWEGGWELTGSGTGEGGGGGGKGMDWRKEWEEIMDVEVKGWGDCFGPTGRGL